MLASRSSIFLLLSCAFSIAPGTRAAFARSPLMSESMSEAETVQFEVNYAHFSKLNPHRLEHLLSRENSKGEVIYSPRSESDRMNEPDLWSTKDPKKDYVEGTSTDLLYEKYSIPNDPSKDVIVAVIDGGIDINHEDLRGKIWTNPDEKGHDEDHDGYLNDLHGWNFLSKVVWTNLEVTREYARLNALSQQRALNTTEKTYFERVQKSYQAKLKDTHDTLELYRTYEPNLEILKNAGLKDESLDSLDEINTDDPVVNKAKQMIRPFFAKEEDLESVLEMIQKKEKLLKYSYNLNLNSSLIIGDHPNLLEEIGYGSNDVKGGDAKHGTHVAGIIAANRLNGIGILGQAQNVKIMPLRAIPAEGDERDKDVANAILYAVQHGARVINMSFGKEFSPLQERVRTAAAYAASKGVLMVHAAGNSGISLEAGTGSYPNKKTLDPGTLDYWIEVGASNRDNFNQRLAAKFSNFGKSMVDLFAPGVSIVSTTPNHEYASLQGTSFAAPEVSGIAALLMSQFPKADAKTIRRAILETVNTYPGLQVLEPSKSGEVNRASVNFDSLSATGGTVNALRAMDRMTEWNH